MASVYTPGDPGSAQPAPHEVIPSRTSSLLTKAPPESPYLYKVMISNKYNHLNIFMIYLTSIVTSVLQPVAYHSMCQHVLIFIIFIAYLCWYYRYYHAP